ncbi:unnamed protein product [Thelazia callipaeda]|uniref:Ovule protein n=1 Tax=Thelazia callipaeda TaxID=103827 RepID=A0A0N5CR03_THECL|nr:unnamed protein product [Thelazia callipaeda]
MKQLQKQVFDLFHYLDIMMSTLQTLPKSAYPYLKLTYYPGSCVPKQDFKLASVNNFEHLISINNFSWHSDWRFGIFSL